MLSRLNVLRPLVEVVVLELWDPAGGACAAAAPGAGVCITPRPGCAALARGGGVCPETAPGAA